MQLSQKVLALNTYSYEVIDAEMLAFILGVCGEMLGVERGGGLQGWLSVRRGQGYQVLDTTGPNRPTAGHS